jgi:endonuclease YncB( thermonuclease family)
MRGWALIGAAVLLIVLLNAARVGAAGYFALRPGVTLESGDTWVSSGRRYRLYGVQSCLRGTSFINAARQTQDCGDASMAVFAAFIKDTEPQCASIAKAVDLDYVVCFSTVGGQQLDLATTLITEGYAFASLDAKGLPINPSYAVAEQEAKQRRAGLWQFPSVQHPAVLLSSAANKERKELP